MAGRIAVGVIRRPHGVAGEASVEPWTDSLDRFSELKTVTLVSPDERQTRDMTIERARPHGDRSLVKFGGIETPEEIGELRGWTLEIPESDAKALEENEYFIHDLVGLRLVDAEGGDRGTVVDTEESGGGLLLVVQAGGKRFDVPFAAEICTNVDLESKTMTVNLPEGLDEV